MGSPSLLGLGPQPYGTAHNLNPLYGAGALGSLGHGPYPHAAMLDPMLVGLVILTRTHFEAQFEPPPIKCSLDGMRLLEVSYLGCSVLPWGISLPNSLLEVGTSSNVITASTNGTPT